MVDASQLQKRSFRQTVAKWGLLTDVIGLVISIIVIHIVYLLYINPAAVQAIAVAQTIGDVPERTIAIILNGWQQEGCLIATLWCIWLWVFRYRLMTSDSYLLDLDILHLDQQEDGDTPSGETLLEYVESSVSRLQTRLSDSQLVNALHLALRRIRLNKNFQEANDVAMEACDLHLELLYSKLVITKYILWAIPSLGFLGTVEGISAALGKANEAMGGDISGIGASLGLAFNSTYVALFLSLILMFISNSLQGREERLVARFKHYISSSFIPLLSVKLSNSTESLSTLPEAKFE